MTSRAKAAHEAPTLREINTNPILNTRRIFIVEVRWVGALAAGCVVRSHPGKPTHDWTIAFSDCPELRGVRRGELGREVEIKAVACPTLPEKWRVNG